MKTSGSAENPHAPLKGAAGVSRCTTAIIGLGVWLVAIPLVHGVVPWVISLCWTRHGWETGQPHVWNLFGLVPVALGIAGLASVMVTGFASVSQLPDRVKLGLAPILLLTSGPFAWSRNPMYVSVLTLWVGWSLFYGSAAVGAVCPVMWALLTFIVVPREERSLEACFGETYLRYKQQVPRWLGKRRKS